MPKSYRIKTEIGQDKYINVKLDQDFDQLEILSLKINEADIYTRICSDYGVVVGRVLVNGGFGVPNAKVSVFIPLSEEDEQNPIISELYPYKTLSDINEEGFRYNLLPKEPSYSTHSATGTFPTRDEVLLEQSYIEVYDKYYKYTVKTNESGDYMIFGLPTGTQTIVMDLDLSDIGCFSLSPQDLIQAGLATPSQLDGNKFKTSTNLNELPQIKTLNKIAEISPFWGDEEICQFGITRMDFDLTAEANIKIEPTAIFMGSLVSTTNEDSVKRNCKPKNDTGNMCDLVAGPGQILAIRQTIFPDGNGDPILEQFKLEEDGKVIDDNGTWLINVPMNFDYVITNEFGQQVISNDPKKGIPTKGKYRFKIKWQNEQGLQNDFLRGNFLVPNIKEHGWANSTQITDPFNPSLTIPTTITIPVGNLTGTTVITSNGGLLLNDNINSQNYTVYINGSAYYGDPTLIPVTNGDIVEIVSNPVDDTQIQTFNYSFLPQDYFDVLRSYAFSLDWDDYVDKQSAINCEDTFYEFNYNKVYTVSSFIDRYKNGKGRSRHLGIKEITNRSCQSENNKFPVNDLQRNFDFIEFVVSILLFVLKFPLIILIALAHYVASIWPIFKWLLLIGIPVLLGYMAFQAFGTAAAAFPALGIIIPQILAGTLYIGLIAFFFAVIAPRIYNKKGFSRIALPMISYPDCDACACEDRPADFDEINSGSLSQPGEQNNSQIANVSSSSSFSCGRNTSNYNRNPNLNKIQNDSDSTVVSEANFNYYQIFSGVDDINLSYRRGSRTFLTKEGGVGAGPNSEYGYPVTEPWAQKLNSFNLRDKYFDNSSSIGGINQITTSINGSANFKDQVIVIIGDSSMNSTFQSGDIVTFQNPALSTDLIRLTGLTNSTGGTIINEFGTSSITGTTQTGLTLSTTIFYADPSDSSGQTNIPITIPIIQTGNTKTNYNFISDAEYFQVITGMTVQDFLNQSPDFSVDGTFASEYLYHRIRYTYEEYGTGNSDYSQSWLALGTQCDIWNKLSIMVLVRGVDPYTDRQDTTYGLGRLFGYSNHNQVQVSGKFKLNYPIRGYSNGLKPVEHNTIDNTPSSLPNGRGNYYPSFTFTPDNSLFSQYQNTNSVFPYYYLSTDFNNSGLGSYIPSNIAIPNTLPNLPNFVDSITNRVVPSYNFGSGTINELMLPLYNSLSNPDNLLGDQYTDSQAGTYPNTVGTTTIPFLQNYYVGGGSVLLSNQLRDDQFIGGAGYGIQTLWWVYSPGYHTYGSLPGVNFNNPQGIVMRSDRLPTSTTTEGTCTSCSPSGNVNTSFALHQNNSFTIYKIPDTGILDTELSITSISPDQSGSLQDLDYTGSVGTAIVNSLSCSGLVELKCYTGSGVNFGIDQTCLTLDKVENGCYYLLNKPYILSLDDDIKLFLEWSTRFRINFAACRGVFSHMFQNNWINGVLYMPSFNKGTIFNIFGQVSNYEYCNNIVIYDDVSNNFYYRSSPWNGTDFVGAAPPPPTSSLPGLLPATPDPSQNTRQILFPTTIMDLGNRDIFISEICANTNFSGEYIVNTFKSTSYNDSSDLLQLGVISRLLNSTWSQQLLNTGDASVNQFFSRDGDRIDGDLAQSFSINSEYEINPFISGNYPDNQIYISEDTPGKPVFGIFYDMNEEKYKHRRALSPGISIFNISPLLQNVYGYPSTQDVPNYKWKLNTITSIFGNENNNWSTSAPFYNKKYQEFDASSGDYFTTTNSASPNINFGVITNFTTPYSFINPMTPDPTGGTTIPFLVGAPNHFYFGLKNGKTALNRFIKTYIETAED